MPKIPCMRDQRGFLISDRSFSGGYLLQQFVNIPYIHTSDLIIWQLHNSPAF